MKNWWTIFLLLVSGFAGVMADPPAQSIPDAVTLIHVRGPISPTTTNYIVRGIASAKEAGHAALIIQMDTPGGLLESTKDIVQAMLASDDLPIVVYVAPRGASAASAGTFITMAAHIAAMAPATNIGAASPVQMGGGGMTDTVMQKKIFEYSESYIESIANQRGRNAEWAISAVRDGKSITGERAVEIGVIDLLAGDLTDLLDQIDGREVAGKELNTKEANVIELPENFAEKVLSFLIRPEIMLILTMVAIYGIIGEVTNPGAIVPGVAGVISLILVLFASATIPINTAGFILIGLAIVLFIAEAFTPTFGLLITGGAVSFFLGVMMLFQDLPDVMSISWGWLIPATVLTVLFFIWIAVEGIRVQFRSSSTGASAMVGKQAVVVEDVDSSGGRVFVFGEYWNAVSDERISEGETCEIIAVDKLTLKVRKIAEV